MVDCLAACQPGSWRTKRLRVPPGHGRDPQLSVGLDREARRCRRAGWLRADGLAAGDDQHLAGHEDAASLARKTAALAISSAVPQRRNVTVATVAGLAAGSSPRLRLRSVAVQPGHRALTRMPSAPHATASDFVSEIRPAFAAPSGACR